MKRKSAVLFALAVFFLIAEGKANARDSLLYLDVLSAEAVGNFSTQRYDLYGRRGDDERFIGSAEISRGTVLAGGIGARLVYAFPSGLRISGEASIAGGPLLGAELPWNSTSIVMRGEVLGGIGYQFGVGPVVLHAAAILGSDYTSVKVSQLAVSSTNNNTAGAPTALMLAFDDEQRLERFSLRAGAQLGGHLELSRVFGLYSDVTFDYDGQWRVRCGLAVGGRGSLSPRRYAAK